MNLFKRLSIGILLGFCLGSIVASFVAPSSVEWYNTPGDGDTMSMCRCGALARSTIHTLLLVQTIGAAVGVAVGVAGAIVLSGKKDPPSTHTVGR